MDSQSAPLGIYLTGNTTNVVIRNNIISKGVGTASTCYGVYFTNTSSTALNYGHIVVNNTIDESFINAIKTTHIPQAGILSQVKMVENNIGIAGGILKTLPQATYTEVRPSTSTVTLSTASGDLQLSGVVGVNWGNSSAGNSVIYLQDPTKCSGVNYKIDVYINHLVNGNVSVAVAPGSSSLVMYDHDARVQTTGSISLYPSKTGENWTSFDVSCDGTRWYVRQ